MTKLSKNFFLKEKNCAMGIKPVIFLALLFSWSPLFSQQRISGKVLDASISEVIAGASVSIKSTSVETIPKSQRDINPEGLWQNWGYDGYDPDKTGVNPYAAFEPQYANE